MEETSDRNVFIAIAALMVLLLAGMFVGFAIIEGTDHRHERRQLERCLQHQGDRVICAVGGGGP